MEANKAGVVEPLLEAKRKSGETYCQWAQLKPLTVPMLREALPDLSEELLREMMKPPWRSYDPNLMQEPSVYRFHETVMHYAEGIKEIIMKNTVMEYFNCSVDKVCEAHGKEHVVVMFDGKFLPFNE